MQARIKDEYKTIFFRDKLIENHGQIFNLSNAERNDYRFTTNLDGDEIDEDELDAQERFNFNGSQGESTGQGEFKSLMANDSLESRFEENPESLTKKEIEELTKSLGLDLDSRKSKAKLIEELQDHVGK